VPDTPDYPDPTPIEVGVRIKLQGGAVLQGVRFYKGSNNGGNHVGHVWVNGALAKTVAFDPAVDTGEGWREALFTDGDLVAPAGADVVVSVFMPEGNFAFSGSGLSSMAGSTSAPLYAPADTSTAHNGVYLYDPAGGFPTWSFTASHYYVDAIANDTVAPPAPPAPIAASQDASSVQLHFGVASDGTGVVRTQHVYRDGVEIAALAGTATWYADTGLTSGVHSYTVIGEDFCGNRGAASDALSVTIAAGTTANIFGDTTPALVAGDPSSPVELGTKFQTDVTGKVTGVRIYRAETSAAVYTVSLWAGGGGSPLATATSAGGDAGWQSVPFAGSGVTIEPNTTYVVSYFASDGRFGFTPGGLTSAVPRGHLTALASGTSGGNGVYAYSATSTFPTQSFSDSNYFADVEFVAGSPPPPPPPPSLGSTIFGTNDPAASTYGDSNSTVELGVKFSSSTAGIVHGVRFFRNVAAPANTVVSLWAADGSLITSATGSSTTAGWQYIPFDSGVAIAADTVYTASYWSPDGLFAITFHGHDNATTNAPLTALASCTGPTPPSPCTTGGNGVYSYSAATTYPASTYESANYWVDVSFTPDAPTGTCDVGSEPCGSGCMPTGSICCRGAWDAVAPASKCHKKDRKDKKDKDK
jgi:hypothetical protein